MNIYNFKMLDIKGNLKDFNDYKGKVLLIVNVASKCGNTHQYADLEYLYKKYKDNGFEILGFPCNQFFRQEPLSENEIYEFCRSKFDVTFTLFSKINVNGKLECELYKYLKETKPWSKRKSNVQWNFEKFLIDRKGNITNRFEPKTNPLSFENDIVDLLKEGI